MWIYIPDKENKKNAWVGTVSYSGTPKSWWTFELIRHADINDLYRTNPFEYHRTVIGLLDHQRVCTLIRPLVRHVDPGSLGVRISFPRTRIEGDFQALLTNLQIEDDEEKVFSGISFESDAFSAWNAQRTYNTNFDSDNRKYTFEITGTDSNEFEIAGVGHVTCTSRTNLSSSIRSETIKSVCVFRLDVSEPTSLNKIILISVGFERLFGFLVGFRGKLPCFNVRLNKTYRVGEIDLPTDGMLEIGGIDWKEGDAPHPMKCIHLNGIGGVSLQTILEKFMSDQENIVTRIHAVEFCRFLSRNLNDKFSVLMPILEEYIKNKFTGEDEKSYMQYEKKFFDFIESSSNNDIMEFSKKHISVKNQKSPSLKTLLTRAIKEVNLKGFSFQEEMAEHIQKRRGRMFHSAPDMMSEKDVAMFYDEIRAATGILMMHTYMDLGIDISALAGNHSALWDFKEFLPEPEISNGIIKVESPDDTI